jgi:hypothetical protein
MLTMRDRSVGAAASLAFRTMVPGGDLKELATPKLKLHEYQKLSKAATSGEIRQETE